MNIYIMRFNRPFGQLNRQHALKLFNNRYFDLLDFMKSNTKSSRFNRIYTKNQILKSTMSDLFIKIWYDAITRKYYDEIMEENIDYFLKKDLDIDNKSVSYVESNVNEMIHIIREIYPRMNEMELDNVKKNIKEMTELSKIYRYK